MKEKVKDLEIKMTLQNYKGVEDGEYVFEGSYLYLIKGKNRIGKTSIAEAFISLMKAKIETPNPIKGGADKATLRGSLPGPKGIYTVEVNVTPKGPKWVMFTPDNIKVSSVTEIRKVFEYNILSVEEFVRKSYTPEGRRQQIKMILELLPEDKRNLYKEHLKALDPKKGKLYFIRRDIKAKLDSTDLLIEEYRISEEDAKLIEGAELTKKHLETIEKTKEGFDKVIENQKKVEKLKEDIQTIRNNTNDFLKEVQANNNNDYAEIKDLEERILKLEGRIKDRKIDGATKKKKALIRISEIEDEIKTIVVDGPDKEAIEDVENQIKELKDNLDKIQALQIKNENLKKYLNQKANLEVRYQKVEKNIEDIRKANSDILKNSDLKDYNIEIKDDTLYIGGLVFNEHQVADSLLTLTAANILIKTLKNSQIMVVGKLAELDADSKKLLYNIGKQNNVAIIGDVVDDSYENVYVSGFISEDIPNVKEFVEKFSEGETNVQPKQEEAPIEEDPNEFPENTIPENTLNIDAKETRNTISKSMTDKSPFEDNSLI